MSRFQKSYSDAEIRRLAMSLLSFLGISNRSKVDLLQCVRSGSLWTVRGVKRLLYEVCNDAELGTDDARTTFLNDAIKISVKASIHAGVVAGQYRARFTLAHELGHAVMHDGVTRARNTGASGSQVRKWEKAYEAPERLANKFAEAFLVDDATAAKMSSAGEISHHFGISETSASIILDRIEAERHKIESAKRVKRKADAFIAQRIPDPVLACATQQEACPCCGHRRLVSDGPKHTCLNCGRTADHFQDGDQLTGY